MPSFLLWVVTSSVQMNLYKTPPSTLSQHFTAPALKLLASSFRKVTQSFNVSPQCFSGVLVIFLQESDLSFTGVVTKESMFTFEDALFWRDKVGNWASLLTQRAKRSLGHSWVFRQDRLAKPDFE